MSFSTKQDRFISEYLIDCDGKKAAIRAGYSVRTASVQASKMLTIPNIKQEIARRKKELALQNDFDAKRHRRELLVIVDQDIREYYNDKGELKEISELTELQAKCIKQIKVGKYGRELVMHDRIAVMHELGRLNGHYEKDNSQQRDIIVIKPTL